MAERELIKVKMEEKPGLMVLSPAGEIGYQEAPAFKQYIKQAYDRRPGRLIVDLAGVDYMSTPGLATLVEALQISRKTQIPLVICGLNDRVRAIFEIAQLHKVFKITNDAEAAATA
jgi:anti-sigma B factor antagonist